MKTRIMTASILLLLFIVTPVFSLQEHHLQRETNASATQAGMERI